MTKKLLSFLPCLLAASPLCPAQPPQQIDLSQFPADSIEDVVVPVPSEIFNVLDKLGEPNWRAELPDHLGSKSPNRAQVALLLGTVIADGFIAVQAQDTEKVKEIGQEVLSLSDAINVRKAVLSRSKSIIEKADRKEWPAVRREFDGALQDVRSAMEELGDGDLAQLVSLGGWVRGTQVLTSVVLKNYSPEGADLLNQPQLVDLFLTKINGLSNKNLKTDPLVLRLRKLLRDLKPIIARADKQPLNKDLVNKINLLTANSVNAIKSADN